MWFEVLLFPGGCQTLEEHLCSRFDVDILQFSNMWVQELFVSSFSE